MPTTYCGCCVFLLNFNFRGGDDRGVLLHRQVRELDLGGAPSLVAERASGRRFGWYVAHEFHEVRILRGRLGVGTFHTIDHWNERDVATDGIAALIVKFAHGGTD